MAELIGSASLEPMIRSAVELLEAHGVDTLVVSAGSSIDDEVRAWETLARSHCDGMIVHADALSNDRLSRLVSTRKNVVLANLDNKLAGQLAAKHLLHMGHQHIAMVTGPEERYSVQQLSDGFSQQINQCRSARIKLQMLSAPMSRLGGSKAMTQLLNSNACPSAVFFHCDAMALGALTTCQEQATRVPEDISVIGCGDLYEAPDAPTPLSTVRQPLAAIGEWAAKRVMRQLKVISELPLRTPCQESLLPVLVTRKSVDEKTGITLSHEETSHRISKRERECLQWASQGKTSWEISQILGVTESTVIYHLRNATRKLNAANRLHAVAKALKASIIDF